MSWKSIPFLFVLSFAVSAHAQLKVGSNVTTINANSLLELETNPSTNSQGLVFPRVNITAVTGFPPFASAPLAGTVVYNTNAGITGGSGTGIYFWDGAKWNYVQSSSGPTASTSWLLLGNSGITQPAAPATYGTSTFGAAENWIGTTDAKDFTLGTADKERMRILSGGGIGIGTSTQLGSALLSLKAGTFTTFLSTDNNSNWSAANSTGNYELFLVPRGSDNVTYLNYGGSGMSIRSNGGLSTLFFSSTNQVGINMGGSTMTVPSAPGAIFEIAGNNLQTNTAYEPLLKLDASTSTTSPYTRGTIATFYHSYNTTAAASYVGLESYDATNAFSKHAIVLNEYGGNVGIGTSNPTSTFHVKSVSGNDFINIDNSLTTVQSGINFLSNGTTKANAYFDPTIGTYGTYGAILVNDVGATSANTLINPAFGKVGIGIKGIPGQELEVAGTANTVRIDGLKTGSTFNTAAAAATSTILYSNNTTGDIYALQTPSSQGLLVSSATGVPTWVTSLNLNGLFWSLIGNTNTTAGTNFIGTTDAVDFVTKTSGTERMRVLAAGDVGIGATGTATGTEKLTVAGATLNGINGSSAGGTYGVLGSNTVAAGFGVEAINSAATGYALYANNTTGVSGAGLKVYGTSNLIGVATLGTPASYNGSLIFNSATTSNSVTINSGSTSASYSLTLPLAQGAANTFLSNNGSGTLSWSAASGVVTANNGLNYSGTAPENIQLGGALITPTIVSGDNANNLTFSSTAGTISAVNITAPNLTTGSALNISAATTTGIAETITNDGVTNGTGIGLSVNGLTNGSGLKITSSSPAGGASNFSYLLNLARSGANTNSSHTAYGIASSVTNTGTTGTNIAGYFNASGATASSATTNNNAAINVPSGGGQVIINQAAGANTNLEMVTRGSTYSDNQVSTLCLYAGAPQTITNTAGTDISSMAAGLLPFVYRPDGYLQVQMVVFYTNNNTSTVNLQLEIDNASIGTAYPIVNTDPWTYSNTTGSALTGNYVATSPWKDFNYGTNSLEAHLYAWISGTSASITIQNVYLIIRPKNN